MINHIFPASHILVSTTLGLSLIYNIIIVIVTVHSRLSLSMGLQGVAAGANPSLVSGRGQGTPRTS